MKRLAVKLLVFLLLGAIINVAVAWGCAVRWKYTYSTIGLTDRSEYFQHAAHNEFAAGMPLRCLEGQRDSALWRSEVIDGFWLIPKSSSSGHYFLPRKPIWLGFTINTIFYAAIMRGFFAVPGYLTRRRRIKRGECVRCAYPLGVSDTCTECGATV